jgi:cyanophycin synthetase
VRGGFASAHEHSRSVIVETFVAGDDHRLLVVNGELIAATKRTPGHVVGDGVKTIAQLVEIVNQDPRRGVGHEKVLTRLELDAQAAMMMARVDYTADSIPKADEIVYLRSTANLSTGGTATDVTDIIHPDNRDMAVRAVRAIGLDVGGVDFISPNIAESYKSIGGAIPPARSSTCCFRRARRRACRSPRSPAPMARPRPRACSRTSPRWPATRRA